MNASAFDPRLVLPPQTILDGSYCIERVVGHGGFGLTYLAEDLNLGTTVAIKEYYPFDFGDRDELLSVQPKSERHKKTFDWGLSSFLQEARTLARFRHPSVVQVTRVFEAFSTAYMVMDFEKGKNFEEWLDDLNRPPSQEELDAIAAPLLDALEMMHAANFLHRDIAPDNIIVRENGTPVLLDFGAARRALAEMSRKITGIVKAGYSPHEQYTSDNRLQGPWSDLYALGGTLYRAVTGKPPEEAALRVDIDHMPRAVRAAMGNYRKQFLEAIDDCLKVKGTERPQSVAQLRPKLLALEPHSQPGRARSEGATSRRRAAIAAAIIAVFGGGYGVYEFTQWEPGSNFETRQRAIAAVAKKKSDDDQTNAAADAKEPRRGEENARAAALTLSDEERTSFVKRVQDVLKASQCYDGPINGRAADGQDALDHFVHAAQQKSKEKPVHIELAEATASDFDAWLRDADQVAKNLCSKPKPEKPAAHVKPQARERAPEPGPQRLPQREHSPSYQGSSSGGSGPPVQGVR